MKEQGAWVFEKEVPFDDTGVKFGFKFKKKLYSGSSKFQAIDVYDLHFYGRTLFLDGILQTTELDEFIYHEMLAHTPLFTHPDPKRVLIVGGGDGGMLEEALKHKKVEEVCMVEIDKKVVEVSRKYLPSISKNAFSDKRARVSFEDGRAFMKKQKGAFDVIILDLSDPDGPAAHMVSLPFYREVKAALRTGGIISVQSGSWTCQPTLVAAINKRLKKVFKYVQIKRSVVPGYQAGEFSFAYASDFNFPNVSKNTLARRFKNSRLQLRYWSPDMHEATTVLPKYLQDVLKK